MLSYLHSFHAGCPADVHKHALLATLVDFLVQKGKPMTVMETHAGRGFYDLSSKEAKKTQEANLGIHSWSGSKILAGTAYQRCLEAIHHELGPTFYPGSPYICRSLLQSTDVHHLMELHPQEFECLKKAFKPRKSQCHFRDGYEGVLAISPPPIRRGLVFIDPSYEVKTEYKQIVDFARKLNKKWPECTIVLWYPLLSNQLYLPMCNALQHLGIPHVWRHEWMFKNHDQRMLGTGIIVLNTPFGASTVLNTLATGLERGT